MGKMLMSLNRYISLITDIDEKWFVVSEHTINHLCFGYACSPQLENYFSFASIFLLFFLFLLPMSTFKLLNALHLKFEPWKISERSRVRLKSRVPGWRDPPQSSPAKF